MTVYCVEYNNTVKPPLTVTSQWWTPPNTGQNFGDREYPLLRGFTVLWIPIINKVIEIYYYVISTLKLYATHEIAHYIKNLPILCIFLQRIIFDSD